MLGHCKHAANVRNSTKTGLVENTATSGANPSRAEVRYPRAYRYLGLNVHDFKRGWKLYREAAKKCGAVNQLISGRMALLYGNAPTSYSFI